MTTKEKIEIIRDVAAAIGGAVEEEYSGRGMYGKTCFGIDCDDDQTAIEEAAERGLKGASRDSLGKGFIVYWPSVNNEAQSPNDPSSATAAGDDVERKGDS